MDVKIYIGLMDQCLQVQNRSMTFQSDKTKENKIRTAANTDSLEQNSGSSSRFVDNRPEAVVQRRLKEIIQNKSVKHTVSFQSPVIQLAALVANKLNVVGEDHKESMPQWKKEFDMARVKINSDNFWSEPEFKTDLSGVHQQDKEKNTKGADPTLERVRYIMASFASELESAFSALDHVLPPGEDNSSESQQDLALPEELVTDSNTNLEEQQIDILSDDELDNIDLDEIFRQELLKALTKLKKATGDLYAQIDMAVTEEMHKHLHYLIHNGSPDTLIGPVTKVDKAVGELKIMTDQVVTMVEPEKISEQLTLIAHKGKELHDYLQEAKWISPEDNNVIEEPGETMDDAKVKRSQEMHQAANMNHAVPGVWKVGEDHVQDILKFLQLETIDPANYNLLTRAEFQEIYKEYYSNE